MPPPLAYWVDNLPQFLGPHWGNFGIHYYGLAYVLGFVAAFWLLLRYARAGRSQLPAERVESYIVAVIVGVYLGGRLGSYFLYGGRSARIRSSSSASGKAAWRATAE